VTRWSQGQFNKYQQRRGIKPVAAAASPTSLQRMQALGRLKIGEMNSSEKRYDAFLREETYAGRVLWHKFEAIKLRLADNTFYTSDFAVLAADSVLELHEVKGFWQDDARVKIKVAASLYPFRFIAVKVKAKKHGGGWEREEF
jgi:hypothetical protein